MKHRRQFLAEARRELRSPICWPFVDDGPITRNLIAEFREARPADDDEVRIALCEARYRDWQRSRFTVIQGGKQ